MALKSKLSRGGGELWNGRAKTAHARFFKHIALVGGECVFSGETFEKFIGCASP